MCNLGIRKQKELIRSQAQVNVLTLAKRNPVQPYTYPLPLAHTIPGAYILPVEYKLDHIESQLQ